MPGTKDDLPFGRTALTRLLVTGGVLVTIATATATMSATPSAADIDNDVLRLEERVRCSRAIEEVYWRHRIWPAENPGAKPALDTVLPDAVLRERVATYLEQGAADFFKMHGHRLPRRFRRPHPNAFDDVLVL